MKNQRKIGIILSYLSQLVQILSSLLYTPVMLSILGQNEYGLYQLVYSVVAYLSLLSLGFTSSYMRYFSRYEKRKEKERIYILNGMFMTIFIIISMICLILGIIMINNISFIFGKGLHINEHNKIKVLLFIMIINTAISFPASVFDCITSAQESFLFQKLLMLLQNLLNPFICLPLLLLGMGSVGMVIVSLMLTILKLIVNIWYCYKKLNVKFIFKKFDLSLLKEMWIFTFFIFLNQIIDQINWNVDKLLLGRFVGTTAVAIYGVGNTIRTMYNQISSAISNVFIPKINRIAVQFPDKRGDILLTQLMTKVGRIQFIILALILSGFISYGRIFIKLWVGDIYNNSFWVAIFIMIPGTVALIQNMGIEIQRAKNMHQSRSIVYTAISVLNVLMSIPLIKKYGAVGASIGTCIAIIAGNIIFMNVYYHKKIGLDMIYFWKNIISFIPALIPNIILGMIVYKLININSWIGLFYIIVIHSVIYCLSMWGLGFNNSEKQMILNILNKVRSGFLKLEITK